MTDVLKVLNSSLEQWTKQAIESGWLPAALKFTVSDFESFRSSDP